MASPQKDDQDREVLDALSSWSSSGQAKLRGLLAQTLSQAQHTSNQVPVSALLLSILRHHVLSRRALDAEPVRVFVQVYSSDRDTSQCLPDLLIDAIWSLDEELDSRHTLLGGNGKNPSLSLDSTPSSHPLTLGKARSRLAEVLGQLVLEQVLTEDQAGQRLEISFLVLAGLSGDGVRFSKRQTQIRTSRFYKLQKYNLLREENEGYTAMISEILSNLGPATVPSRLDAEVSEQTLAVLEQESSAQRNKRARRVMDNVLSLIGQFKLDASRVLDIILDLFAFCLKGHYRFFLALLSVSPWTPDSEPPLTDSPADQLYAGVNLDLSHDTGNHRSAQLLGHKMAYYCQTNDSGAEDLYMLIALLIKSGLVRFVDIYPCLSPGEEGMQKLRLKHRQALSAKASSARSNALSMAAPLANETDAGAGKTSSTNGASDATLKDPPNQIIGVLHALLAIGDLRHSLFLLTRFPWLCTAYNEIADSFLRILKFVVKPAYNEISVVRTSPATALASGPKPHWDPKLHSASSPMLRQLMTTICIPEPLPSANTQYVFFYSDWHTDLPTCRSPQDVLNVFLPLLHILGVALWRDPALLQQICRLTTVGVRLASRSADEVSRQIWLNVLRHHLLPALSLSPSNSGILSEVWKICNNLLYEERFSLYGQWKYELYQSAELRAAQAETEKEAKGILKRISKDNLKQSGRNLAKAAHSNPTIFFTVALNQVQAYDNLIQPLVESAKYLSNLEYDIFAFILIDALSNPEKERTKQDGTNISLWLKSLASFCGTLYRRYALMDCVPVLQYLVNQLKAGNSKDLVIMSELITKMSGIEPLANLADSQIAALTGGRLLHMEAMMAANALTGSKERVIVRRSGQRLLKALVESKLAVPLLILVAQQHQSCIHLVPESEAHLKYLGNLYDSCQEVLLQYIEFLYNHLDTPEYASIVPSLGELGVRYGIDPAIVFYIARPKLVHSMKQVEATEAAEKLRSALTARKDEAKSPTKDSPSGDVDMASTEPTSALVEPLEASDDVEMAEASDAIIDDVHKDPETSASPESSDVQNIAGSGPWHAGLEDATEAALAMLPAAAHPSLGVHFYVTFWQLGLPDINVPFDRYQQETKRLKSLIGDTPAEEHKRRLQDTVTQLDAEMKDQMKSHEVTRKRLRVEKDHWFSDSVNRDDVVAHLIQYCLFPRALLSPTDAIFAGKFLRRMHDLGTRNFCSLSAYEKLFGSHIATIVFSSTENEARNYSRFLHTILADLSSWHRSSDAYAKDVVGEKLPGFQRRWGDRHGGEEIPAADLPTWEDFRILFCNWQKNLQTTFLACLGSREYMRIRNAIVIMTRIAPFFPVVDAHGSEVMEVVEKLGHTEPRGDLKILAQGLLATLKARKKDWIPEHKARNDVCPVVERPSQVPIDLTADDPVAATDLPAKASVQLAPNSQSSQESIEVLSVKLNGSANQVDKSDMTPASKDVDQPAPADRANLAKLPSGVVLPNRPATASRKTDANDARSVSGTRSEANDSRTNAGKDVRAVSQSQTPAGSEGPSTAADATRRDAARDTRANRPERDSSAASAKHDEPSRPANLPQRPLQSSRDVPSAPNRGSWDDDHSSASRRPQENRSASDNLASQAVKVDPRTAPVSAASATAERDASGWDISAAAASRQEPDQDLRIRDRASREQADRSRAERDRPDRVDRDRADRDRLDRDGADRDRSDRGRVDRDRTDRDRVREPQPVDDRHRSRHHDVDDRRSVSGRERDRRGTDWDDRRRSSGRSSRNQTPVAEAAMPDRGSGHSTPLRPHRGDPVAGRDEPSLRSTPAAPDDGGDSRKRSLVDRLTSASARDQPPEDDSSKRMRLTQSQRPSDSAPSALSESRPPFQTSGPPYPESRSADLRSRLPDARSTLPDARSRLPESRSADLRSPLPNAQMPESRSAPYSSRPSSNDNARQPTQTAMYSSRPSAGNIRQPVQSTMYSSRPGANVDFRQPLQSAPYSSRPTTNDDFRQAPQPAPYSSRPTANDDFRQAPQPAPYSSRPTANDDFRQAPQPALYSSRPSLNDDVRQVPHAPTSQPYGHGRRESRDVRDVRDYHDQRRDRSARRAGNA